MSNDALPETAVAAVVGRIHELWQAQRYDEIGEFLDDAVVIAPPGGGPRVCGRDAYVQSYRDYDRAVTTNEFVDYPFGGRRRLGRAPLRPGR